LSVLLLVAFIANFSSCYLVVSCLVFSAFSVICRFPLIRRLNGQEMGLAIASNGGAVLFDVGPQDVDECALGTHDCGQECVDGMDSDSASASA
jgi:hypothetical protein